MFTEQVQNELTCEFWLCNELTCRYAGQVFLEHWPGKIYQQTVHFIRLLLTFPALHASNETSIIIMNRVKTISKTISRQSNLSNLSYQHDFTELFSYSSWVGKLFYMYHKIHLFTTMLPPWFEMMVSSMMMSCCHDGL